MEEAAARSLGVTLRYFDGCPHWRTLYDRLHQDAERLRFLSSPTILIEGRDPFGDADEGSGLLCRVYMTPDGLAGSPTLDQLRTALREA